VIDEIIVVQNFILELLERLASDQNK